MDNTISYVNSKNEIEEEVIVPRNNNQLSSQKEISDSEGETDQISNIDNNIEKLDSKIETNLRRTQSERIKKLPAGWNHEEPIISKTGDAWSRNSARFKNGTSEDIGNFVKVRNTNVTVTKNTLNKILN